MTITGLKVKLVDVDIPSAYILETLTAWFSTSSTLYWELGEI